VRTTVLIFLCQLFQADDEKQTGHAQCSENDSKDGGEGRGFSFHTASGGATRPARNGLHRLFHCFREARITMAFEMLWTWQGLQ
jgi:hypothetical protein